MIPDSMEQPSLDYFVQPNAVDIKNSNLNFWKHITDR